jgi:hypothetical protein
MPRRVLPRILVAALPAAVAGCSPAPPTGCSIPYQGYVTVRITDPTQFDAGCEQLCHDHYLDAGVLNFGCEVTDVDGGIQVTAECEVTQGRICVGGRRPAGFDGVAYSANNEVAAWLARSTALESASVPAFQILAAELRAHGAPDELVRASLRSAADETRHAQVMSSLARRYRGLSATVQIDARESRSLVEIAVENAAEGRVRERFAAWVAVFQSTAARDPVVRRVFAEIAPEELRHAELADAVDAWAAGLLTFAERRRVDEARAQAHATLAAASEAEPAAALRDILGLPDATRAQDLIAAVPG